jgi:hypothetical protein
MSHIFPFLSKQIFANLSPVFRGISPYVAQPPACRLPAGRQGRHGSWLCAVHKLIAHFHLIISPMSKLHAGFRLLPALLFITFAAAIALPSPPQVLGRTNGILLSVEKGETSGDFWVEPIAVVNKGEFEKLPDFCGPKNEDAQRFQSQYFKAGRTYQLLFGGANAGTIKISPAIANFFGGIAELNGSLVLEDAEMALATNSPNLTKQSGYRRPPTQEERATAEELARNAFRSSGSSDDAVRRMKLETLTVAQLVQGGSPGLIGTAEVAGEGEKKGNRFLFFAAKKNKNADKYFISFKWFNNPDYDADAETLQLVDVVDFNAEGAGELVVVVGYAENHRFQIYKQFAVSMRGTNEFDVWNKIYESGLLGCK